MHHYRALTRLAAAPLLLWLFASTAMAQTSSAPSPQSAPAPRQAEKATKTVSEVVVTASRVDLLGRAATASQGVITRKEVELRPIYRIGQLYETLPGLVVTVHSGEGKAPQYLIRGFNLDHGTDFASFVDGMPVNRPTNTHGQGYSDQNFLMPEIVGGIDYTKGPYYANIGDFGAVASAHVNLINDLPNQMIGSIGTLGDQEIYVGGTHHFDDQDRLWGAIDVGHLDGPWDPPSDFRKILLTSRYSHGTDADGFSVTGMFYQSVGRLETDQPLRAIQEGLIGPFGTLDPSDMSKSMRASLSANYGASGNGWSFKANAYFIDSTMTLWNDFTHFLEDPVNGDQEEQDESRQTFGGSLNYTRGLNLGPIETDTTFGLQTRYDDIFVDRRHTKDRVPLDYCENPQATGPAIPFAAVDTYCQGDRVHLLDLAPYAQETTHWTSWLRTILGVREEYEYASDDSVVTGFTGDTHQFLYQPKASIVLGPFYKTELYVSAGKGFHSDDVRGVFGTLPLEGIPATAGKTPLLAPATGEEVGLRTDIVPRVSVQFSVFREDFSSELAYDQDQGQDTASAPSRRQGVELSAQYHPLPFLELNTDLAYSKARYQGSPAELAEFGFDGPWIANAPTFIGSFGALLDNLGPWFGGLQWRRLGDYAVVDGEQYPRAPGYSEWNLDAGYKLNSGLKFQVSVYNLLDTHADAMVYDYTARLPGEPASGIDGLQVHPLEPRSARFTITKSF
jgi:outer membrane receptor protein involved in Fe transport